MMFTGIVQGTGKVRRLEPFSGGMRLFLDPDQWTVDATRREPLPGDSICVSGVCLTLAHPAQKREWVFDVIHETLGKTTLGRLTAGAVVNLETAVTPLQPLGGHFMQGHVDGMGRVSRISQAAGEWRITVEPPVELMDYVAPKGSVAIDGVSLTLAAVTEREIEVALIPTTLEHTNLGKRQVGDQVNLEMDILCKTLVYQWRRLAGSADATLRGPQSISAAVRLSLGL